MTAGAWTDTFRAALWAISGDGRTFAGYVVDVEETLDGIVVRWHPLTRFAISTATNGRRLADLTDDPVLVANDVAMRLHLANFLSAMKAGLITPPELPEPGAY